MGFNPVRMYCHGAWNTRDFIRDAHPIILNSWTYFRGQDHAI